MATTAAALGSEEARRRRPHLRIRADDRRGAALALAVYTSCVLVEARETRKKEGKA